MENLKLRETNILKIVEDSLAKLPQHDKIIVKVKNCLEDEAVWIDHNQMVIAFLDLEKNSVEAMPNGGMLTITVTGDDHRVEFELTDTGAGIAEENMPFLFVPFFTTKPVGEGTGLGLPSTYATVKAHRGDISITSNADSKKGPTGTVVRITLPRRQVLQNKEARIILHDEEDDDL